MELKKPYEDNKWWNDWKIQLDWNKLEWVSTRTLFSFFKKSYLNKNNRTSHWVGHSALEELYTIDLKKTKHMIEETEAEMTESS